VLRTRASYLESLRDGRQVVWAGRLVPDMTTQAETSAYAEAVAARYELDGLEPCSLPERSGAGSAPASLIGPAELRIVREASDGIVVRGWTSVAPAAPFAQTFAARIRRESQDGAAETLVALVPAGHPQVTYFVSPSRAETGASGGGSPTYPGSELTTVAYVEDVTVPWLRVYHASSDQIGTSNDDPFDGSGRRHGPTSARRKRTQSPHSPRSRAHGSASQGVSARGGNDSR
jgi:aromatic ring hydroxylase